MANNPFCFQKFGDVGLICAIVQGKTQRLHTAVQPNSDQTNNSNADTVVGNKSKSKSPCFDEIVLQKSSQCLPLLRFSKDSISPIDMETANNKLLWKIHTNVQKLVDKYFNKGIATNPVRYQPTQEWIERKKYAQNNQGPASMPALKPAPTGYGSLPFSTPPAAPIAHVNSTNNAAAFNPAPTAFWPGISNPASAPSWPGVIATTTATTTGPAFSFPPLATSRGLAAQPGTRIQQGFSFGTKTAQAKGIRTNQGFIFGQNNLSDISNASPTSGASQGFTFCQNNNNSNIFSETSAVQATTIPGNSTRLFGAISAGIGTKAMPFEETIKKKVDDGGISLRFHTISAMPVYETKSLEELRYED